MFITTQSRKYVCYNNKELIPSGKSSASSYACTRLFKYFPYSCIVKSNIAKQTTVIWVKESNVLFSNLWN